MIADARAAEDVVGLRQLLEATVESASIVEHMAGGSGGRAVWERAHVVWTCEVRILLDAGLLCLGPAAAAPVQASSHQCMLECSLHYAALLGHANGRCPWHNGVRGTMVSVAQ